MNNEAFSDRSMNVVIIEDEKVAADHLEKLIQEMFPEILIAAKLQKVRDAIEWFKLNSADLIFLDIHLADGLSFKIFEEVQITTPVIFTTAYDQYAIKAFQLNSIDYLLKPIKVNDLKKSLKKYKELKPNTTHSEYEKIIDLLNNNKPEYKKRFLVKAGMRIKTIQVNDIALFYSIEKSTFLTTFENRQYAIDPSLDKLEHELDPTIYFRVSRKFIIHIESIKEMHILSNRSIKIELQPKVEEDCIVSIHRLSGFKKWLNR